MRCKENFQGDRCKKEANHQLSVAENPDPRHQADFTVWEGEGDSKKVVAKAKGAVAVIKKDTLRKVDKLMAYAYNVADQGDRKRAIAVLDFVGKGLDRGKGKG